MPIDPEQTAAFEHIADRIHNRIDTLATESRNDRKEILDKLTENVKETTAIGVKLNAHVDRLDSEVKGLKTAVSKAQEKADDNKVGLTKLGAGAFGGGGLVAALAEWLKSASE